MLKNICFIFSLFYLCFSYSFCTDNLTTKEPKYIIYQSEINQLNNNLNNIEKEKLQISETLKLQTMNLNNLELNLKNMEKMLNQSKETILKLENNSIILSNKLKNQEITQTELLNQLTINQTQLMVAEKSLKEYKAEIKSQNFKTKINYVIYFICGVGIGIVTEKVLP